MRGLLTCVVALGMSGSTLAAGAPADSAAKSTPTRSTPTKSTPIKDKAMRQIEGTARSMGIEIAD